MVSAMQIIVLFPLFNARMPANAGLFFAEMMKIAAFDLIEMGDFLDSMLSLDPKPAVSEKYEALGYESVYFLHNVGSIQIVVFIQFTLVLIYLLMLPCSGRIGFV